MKSNTLGNTGISVSELSYGSLILGWLQADMAPEESVPVIQKALESGINFFDTAQSYGTQTHLRLGLGEKTSDAVIATKTHERTVDGAGKAFEESLKELGRTYIDIYDFHLIDSADDLANRQAVLDYLLSEKAKGRIRAIGASVHKVRAAKAVAEHPDIDVLFPVLNSRGFGIIDGTADDMLSASRVAADNGKGIYVMKPLGGGHLRSAPEEAFQYLRDTGVVDSICVGMKSTAEVEMNAAILDGREIPDAVLSGVETVPRTLRIYDRCVGCGACVETCDQGALSLDTSKGDPARGKTGQSVVDHTKCILCGYCAEVCPEFTIRII